LEVDPIGLVRSFKSGGRQKLLEHYVNDRPYVASSFLSVALNRVFRSAFTGASRGKQQLADAEIPLEMAIYSVPCRGGESLLRLFEPLGYAVEAEQQALDKAFTDWGDSAYFNVEIRGTKRVRNLLRHVYVLIPVLDKEKHYWVGDDEIEKLLRHGEDWLATHPEKELIASRYLKSRRSLANDALAQLSGDEVIPEEEAAATQEEELEKPIRLNDRRLQAISEVVERCKPSSVLDLGCGEGRLLKELLENRQINEIIGVDVFSRALEIAERRLRLKDMPDNQRSRIKLLNGSLTYRDLRLADKDLAIAAEVVEHIAPVIVGLQESFVISRSRVRLLVPAPQGQLKPSRAASSANSKSPSDAASECACPAIAWAATFATTRSKGTGSAHASDNTCVIIL